MLRLSYWQWTRHEEKLEYIKTLESRLVQQPLQLNSELATLTSDPANHIHRQARVSGKYDFTHEVILMNRSIEDLKGVHVLTPLRISDSQAILVDRGFIPLHLSKPTERKVFHRPQDTVELTLLLKESQEKGFFLAPSDPETGKDLPWVDAFLRPDIKRIERQLPYMILPLYGEIIPANMRGDISKKIIKSDNGKNDIFLLPMKANSIAEKPQINPDLLPVPAFNTVIPPGRHFGYIFEWATMALITLLIGVVIQLRPPRQKIQNQHQSNS